MGLGPVEQIGYDLAVSGGIAGAPGETRTPDLRFRNLLPRGRFGLFPSGSARPGSVLALSRSIPVRLAGAGRTKEQWL